MRALLIAAASFPLFSLLPAITDSWPWLAVGFFAGSLLSGGWNVITVSLRQRIVPDELLGRVNAGYRLLAWGTMPIGAAAGGGHGVAVRTAGDVRDLGRDQRRVPADRVLRRDRPPAGPTSPGTAPNTTTN